MEYGAHLVVSAHASRPLPGHAVAADRVLHATDNAREVIGHFAEAVACEPGKLLTTWTEHKSERDKWFIAHIFAANRVEPSRRCAFGGKSMIITRLSRDSAKQDPGGTFESPLRVVDEVMFTRGEKIATLDQWRRVILRELIAVGEVDRARLLGEIEEARHRLIR